MGMLMGALSSMGSAIGGAASAMGGAASSAMGAIGNAAGSAANAIGGLEGAAKGALNNAFGADNVSAVGNLMGKLDGGGGSGGGTPPPPQLPGSQGVNIQSAPSVGGGQLGTGGGSSADDFIGGATRKKGRF